MTRECHVRFCESAGVRSPRATHLVMAFENFLDAKRVLAVLGKRWVAVPGRRNALTADLLGRVLPRRYATTLMGRNLEKLLGAG